MTDTFVVTAEAAVTADELLALMDACGNDGWGRGSRRAGHPVSQPGG